MGLFAAATPASALEIVLHDIGGVSGSQAETGFRLAARYWESVFTNDARVEINVGYSNLGANILGATGSSLVEYVPIADYKAVLAATGTSALDATATANFAPLNANGGVSVLVPGYISGVDGIKVGTSRLAPDDAINETIALTSANFRALGGVIGPGFIDAQVQFSNQFAFDFNPTDGISAGTYDFLGVAIHEIGHSLGFISGADDFDYADGYKGPIDGSWWGYGLDMFRYSAPGQLDWRPGVDSYFSIDGGQTAFMGGYFSTGENNGDGNQASHWKQPDQATPCQNFLGVMNPYICGGKTDSVTGLDLALFDAIGWNTNVDISNYDVSTAEIYRANIASVPEPAEWALLLAGFGVVGATLRRRRPAQA